MRGDSLDDLDLSDAQRRTLLSIAMDDGVGRLFQHDHRSDKSPHASTLKALRDRGLLHEDNRLTGDARRALTNTQGL